MKNYLLNLILFLLITNSFAQITFQRIYNLSLGTVIHQTPDGGYITTGGNLLKLDAYGNIQWTKNFPFIVYCVSKQVNNKYIIGGEHFNGIYPSDAAIAETDLNGDTLWIKHYPTSYNGSNSYQAQIATDGNYLFTIFDNTYGITNMSYYEKVDTSGNHLWTRQTGSGATSIFLMNADLLSLDYGEYSYETFITKFDTANNLICNTYYQDTVPHAVMTPYSIAEGLDSDYVVAGIYYPYKWISKINHSTCDTLYSRQYNAGSFVSIQGTRDGGYAAIGTEVSDSAIYLFKLDNNLNITWSQRFAGIGSAGPNYLEQTTDGGFIINALTNNSSNTYLYIIKTDSMGYASPLTDVPQYEITNQQFEIFPNPTLSTFTIKPISEIKNALVEIYNVLGEKVYSTEIIGKQQTINNKFPSGIFFVKVCDGEKQFVEKLIVQ